MYRPATLTDWPEGEREGKAKPPARKELTTLAVARLLTVTDGALDPWIAELGKPHLKADGERTTSDRPRNDGRA